MSYDICEWCGSLLDVWNDCTYCGTHHIDNNAMTAPWWIKRKDLTKEGRKKYFTIFGRRRVG